MKIRARVLHPGHVRGPVLRLTEPLSFWGGFDPGNGTIIDRSHPDLGHCLTGAIVLMSGSRGSAGTPGALAEAIRVGTAPSALIVSKPDINLATGALVAETLYGTTCPVLLVENRDLDRLAAADRLTITADGQVTTDS